MDTIVAMRQERITWLADRGSDQWQVGLTVDGFADRVHASIAADQTYVAVDEQGELAGTIAVDTWTNPGLWSEQELAESVIVHRMITWPRATGTGVGALLLEHANKIALREGRAWIRLDAWTSNTDLHTYYERAGFQHVRTIEGHRSKSTALFERQARVTLPTTPNQPVDLGMGLAFVGVGTHQRTYEIEDLAVDYAPGQGVGSTLQVVPGLPWRLWADGDSWFAAAAGTGLSKTAHVLGGDPLSWLNPACIYSVTADMPDHSVVITLDSPNAKLASFR
ncbi:GNAT family N-acetyltransferase [Actinosynnema sp. NPDC023587]|uniref:GNAT family N-acetyltransferase n=1 Tax=Actinosynnema sp. NPDC023587 TaxID=3154695 RepID=UPI0033CD698B